MKTEGEIYNRILYSNQFKLGDFQDELGRPEHIWGLRKEPVEREGLKNLESENKNTWSWEWETRTENEMHIEVLALERRNTPLFLR